MWYKFYLLASTTENESRDKKLCRSKPHIDKVTTDLILK
jgi:hypothetical protein